MCTVNLTFEVPESDFIDIEALKQNIQAYAAFLISYPGILRKNTDTEKDHTDKMLERFAGCWHGYETAEDIISLMNECRTIREPLCV